MNEIKQFIDRDGRLTVLPSKFKKKLLAVYFLAAQIEPEKSYTEGQINTILDGLTTFHDPATLRRELYNAGLLQRRADGSQYRRISSLPSLQVFMDRYGL